MTKYVIRWSLLALVMLVVSACSGNALPVTGNEDVTGQDAVAQTIATLEPVADDGSAEQTELTITELAFEGDGDTFLEAISSAISEYGAPDVQRYTEMEDGAGVLWQGEVLLYGDEQRVFLQQRGGGGASALMIESTADADLSAALAEQTAENGNAGADPTIFPEVRFVRARQSADGEWSFDVTLAYPDSGWEDYADGWHVESENGEILATRILFHPHVNEQPFTRSLGGMRVPDGVTTVAIRSHSLTNGYAPEPLIIPLDESTSEELFEVVRNE